ncbi:MAG TPA: HD domain-containing phosphohydrolase [Phycisphaerales bacterium]|nr:HD domain-containing phosphohydrolase [Phycisphaerales bacterium]
MPEAGDSLRFFPVPMDSLDFRAHTVDLYIRFDATPGQPTLYRSAGLEFTKADAERLATQGVKFLYISAAQHAAYRKALAERLEAAFTDKAAATEERARIVRSACGKMIEDVLLLPGQSEPVAAVKEISERFGEWSKADPQAFTYLLDMSGHDFYTTTHMVNVGVGCGLLAKEAFPNDAELFKLVVQGGLLHDLGKRNIPESVLNKEGKLSDAEWNQIKVHPSLGFEELKNNPEIPSAVLEMVRDHHERPDGKGYPNGVDGSKLSIPAKICGIVDVFDAITAARPYRGPTPPARTLQMMQDGRGTQFDADLFDAWTRVVNTMLKEDPQRAPVAPPIDPKAPPPSLAAFAQVAPEGVIASLSRPAPLEGDQRRPYERKRCDIAAMATFKWQGKKYTVRPGEFFRVRVVDVSRGGLQIETPWPLTLNDVLVVQLPTKDKPIARLCRVVRVRSAGAAWSAGVCFIDAQAAASPAA